MTAEEQQKQVARLASPDGYAEERLGMKLHPKQAAVLRDVFSRNGSRVVNRCANEVGKTRRVLCAAILYAVEIRGAVVVSTAGVFRQIKDQLMPAMKAYAHLFPPHLFEFQEQAIKRYSPKTKQWEDAYTGVATTSEHYFQGYHKDEKRPLFIAIDETQGVEMEICRAAEDRCNPTWMLITGSPGDPQGYFYECETKNAAFYSHHKMNRFDCLKENGWWIERGDIERLIAKHGEDNPFVQSTVFGNFSQIVEDAMLSLGEYDRCVENPPARVLNRGGMHGFCDFAAGRDKNVFALRRGNVCEFRKIWKNRDTMSAVGEFLHEFNRAQKECGVTAKELSGDADGLGLPMLHRLREVGWPLNEFHGGASPRFDDGYKNAVAEAWGETIAKIKRCELVLPDNLDLKAQLLGRKAKRNSSGRLELESKEDMKKRGLDSPDEADAFCCASMPSPQLIPRNLVQQAQELAAETDWTGGQSEESAERRFF